MYKGVVRPTSRYSHCPTCGERFVEVAKHGYYCPKCLTRPEKYMVDISWGGGKRGRRPKKASPQEEQKAKRYQICSDKQGMSLDSYARARKLLSKIQGEIDDHTFSPESYMSGELDKWSFAAKLEAWYEFKLKLKSKGTLTPGTTGTYKTYVDNYYLPFFGGRDVRDIRTPDIKQFYAGLPDGLSEKYVSCIIRTLEGVFRSLWRDGDIQAMPNFTEVKFKLPKRRGKPWIDKPAQVSIWNAIEDERDRPFYIFYLRQGLRPSEARALKLKDFDFENGTVTVGRTYSRHVLIEQNKEKDIKPRIINPELVPMLKEICKGRFPEDFVFLDWRTGRPYNANRYLTLWKDACKQAGVSIRLYNAGRHSLGSQAARAGVPLDDIASVLNHCDSRMCREFYVNDDELAKQRVVFDRLNNVVPIRSGKKKSKK